MSTINKWRLRACLAVGGFGLAIVTLIILVVLPAIPSRPGPEELRLARMIEAWGGRAIIHGGIIRGVDLSGAKVRDGDLAVLRIRILGLRASRSLRGITLSDTEITDAGIANLVGLSPHQLTLQLDRTRISDRALTTIAHSFSGLHSLSLAETAVTEHGLAELKNHPTLKVVVVGGSNITAEVLDRLNEPMSPHSGPWFRIAGN